MTTLIVLGVPAAVKVTFAVCVALVTPRLEVSDDTTIVRATGVAAAYVALPPWFAVTTTEPVPVNVSVDPETVAGPLVTVKFTASPDVELTLNVIGAVPNTTVARVDEGAETDWGEMRRAVRNADQLASL